MSPHKIQYFLSRLLEFFFIKTSHTKNKKNQDTMVRPRHQRILCCIACSAEMKSRKRISLVDSFLLLLSMYFFAAVGLAIAEDDLCDNDFKFFLYSPSTISQHTPCYRITVLSLVRSIAWFPSLPKWTTHLNMDLVQQRRG
jgi:hypothetical protein